MEISIIVPVYNNAEDVRRCVASILYGGVEDVEVLLVNDGSTDDTGSVCDSLAQAHRRVRVQHKENGGVSSARNAGLDRANGRWVTFVDVDDSLLPGALSAMLEIADGVDCVSCETVRGTDVQRPSAWTERLPGYDAMRLSLEDPTRHLTCHGKLIRRAVMKAASIRFEETLSHGEDSEMLIRLLPACGAVLFSGVVAYRYTINRQSAVHRFNPDTCGAYLRMLSMVGTNLSTSPELAQSEALFVLAHLLIMLTHCVFHPANPASISETWKQALTLRDHEPFAGAFALAPLERLAVERRAVLTCLKHRHVAPAWGAIRLRQWQNNRRAGKVLSE